MGWWEMRLDRRVGASNAKSGRMGIFLSVAWSYGCFLPGWHRVEVTNHNPSDDICSGDRTQPWDHPRGPLWLPQTPVL